MKKIIVIILSMILSIVLMIFIATVVGGNAMPRLIAKGEFCPQAWLEYQGMVSINDSTTRSYLTGKEGGLIGEPNNIDRFYLKLVCGMDNSKIKQVNLM